MKRLLREIKEVFDDGLTLAAAILFLLVIALVLVNTYSGVSDSHPLVGVILFAMVPILFIVGGVVFMLALWRLVR